MMIDIDFFKNYNDSYGHAKGDEILKKIAKNLKDSIRKQLTVPRLYSNVCVSG